MSAAIPGPDPFGEGVFETVHLRPGGPWLLGEHLDRLTRSAALLDLPLPSRAELTTLARQAAATWTGGRSRPAADPSAGTPSRVADPSAGTPSPAADLRASGEGVLRIVCARGHDPSVTVSPVPAAALRQRRDGVRLITADSGVSIHRPPWSLSTAKTTSYAPNLAARRWAVAQGADDMLWLSVEGYALEAPTASLVWLTGGTLRTVPPSRTGILPGTTAAHLLARAPELGLDAAQSMVTRAELAETDGIWLASSVRGLAEAISVDGRPRARSRWTGRLLELLGF